MTAKRLTNEEVVTLLRCGVIEVRDRSQARPSVWKHGKQLAVMEDGGRQKDRYYVKLQFHGRESDKHIRRTVLLHCLVWMAENMAAPPEGHEIDHIDGDRHNCSAENLRCLRVEDHRGVSSEGWD